MPAMCVRVVVLVLSGVTPTARRKEAARVASRPTGVTPKTRTEIDDPEVSTCALAQVSLGWSAIQAAHWRRTVAVELAGKVTLKKPIDVAGVVR